jgi:hypothetical protein
MPVGIPKKKPVSLVKVEDYFEHVERKHNPKLVKRDIVEWTEEPIEPTLTVKESRDKRLIARAKRKWEKHIKDIYK